MSLNIGDNFKYLGKKFLDDRESFKTLEAMRECTDVPNGFITFCEEDNIRYEYNDKLDYNEKTGKWREFKVGSSGGGSDAYVGDIEPEDNDVIWFDTGENHISEIKYDNPIIDELFASIRLLQKQVTKLQEDVEYLKIYGGGGSSGGNTNPDDDIESKVSSLSLEDGGLFLLEDGGLLILENAIETIDRSIILLENGAQLLLENGANINLEN
jgi:hypothetical protein